LWALDAAVWKKAISSDTITASNVWTHCAITGDGTGTHMYINGVSSAMTGILSTTNTTDFWMDDFGNYTYPKIGTRLYLGVAAPGDLPFKGYIDDLRGYSRALTSNEVLTVYQATTNPAVARP
jgi:hypothetical protein